jgi:hypothetical protein
MYCNAPPSPFGTALIPSRVAFYRTSDKIGGNLTGALLIFRRQGLVFAIAAVSGRVD